MRLKSTTETPVHVALLSGHSIVIGPEGRDVPEMFRQEAFARGAIPYDAKAEDFQYVSTEPLEPTLVTQLAEVIKTMLVEHPDDFTGAGLPNRKKLSALAGWNVSVQELSAAWEEVQKAAE